MDVTTLTRVKAMIVEPGTGADVALQALIVSMSARFEREARRPFESIERTKTFSVPASRRTITLDAAPVTRTDSRGQTVAAFRVFASSTPDMSGTSELVINRDFIVEDSAGVLRMLTTPATINEGALDRPIAPYYVRVQYTGGLAATQADLELAYPDLVAAADQQIAYLWQRRKSLGGDQKVGESEQSFAESYALLPDVKAVLNRYTRRIF